MFDRCTSCEKRSNTNGNFVKHGLILATGGVGVALAGSTLVGTIPALIGFKVTGIAEASLAASWQSSMGSVAAGSIFSTFQSMGATGAASSLFSSIGAGFSGTGAYFGLRSTASWCECEKPLVDK